MADLSDKGSESEDRVSTEGSHVKTCADCGTTKTPLWRGGPAGPKSLCNACGIRSRKRRRALLGLSKTAPEDKKSKKSATAAVKRKLLEVAARRPTAAEKLRRKMGEEEQAAVLLMALSCGYVYA
ncbi:hypothetical protein NMG60_11032937 [Bertholletia excelsa]